MKLIIFQNVFEWAGDFRTVNISKSGYPFAFRPKPFRSPKARTSKEPYALRLRMPRQFVIGQPVFEIDDCGIALDHRGHSAFGPKRWRGKLVVKDASV